MREVVQRGVACVSRTVIKREPATNGSELVVQQPVAAAGGTVALSIRLRYLVEHDPSRPPSEAWRVRLVSYVYKLDAADGREILSYHWHPAGLSHERRPHLHLGAGFGAVRPEWQKAHLLTGPLGPAVVLEPLITQLGVPPRRADWAGTLAALAAALDDGG